MVKGYGAPQCAMPVEGVAARLCSSPGMRHFRTGPKKQPMKLEGRLRFPSLAGVEALCRVHHVAMSEGKVQFRRAEFQPAAKADSEQGVLYKHNEHVV